MAHRLEINFLSAAYDYLRRQSTVRNQRIAKAVGLKQGHRPFVLDATAGLGGDAYVLAHLGCSLVCVERNPDVFTALRSAISAAQAVGDPAAQRMQILQADALAFISAWPASKSPPDVIYLDPMFPEKQKSALPKLAMRELKALVGSDLDADTLLAPARALASRVVVKRPRLAPVLAGAQPHHQHIGKVCRFDVYL